MNGPLARSELLESEERYRDLVESSRDLLCTHDLDGRLLSVNQAAVRMTGYPREALLAMNLADLLTSAGRDLFAVYLHEVREKGTASGLMRIRTAGGELRWWEYHNTLRKEVGSKPLVRGMAQDVTDRKKAEDALRASEARFRALADCTSVGIFIYEGERLVYGNRANERLTGYAPEEFRGLRFWDLVHPEDRELVRGRGLARQRGQATPESYEFRIVRKDGAVRWMDFNAGRIDWKGAPAVIGTISDVTERREATEALRESESRFRSLTEMSSDFYWESDAEHRLTRRGSADKAVSTVSVFQSGAQLGQRRWEVPYLSPDEAGWRAHRETLDAHLPFRNFELSRLGIDGTERHISISGDPVFDASGAFTGYRGVGTDITERKRVEKELRESEQRFRELAENIDEVFYLVDPQSRQTLYVSPAYETIWGRSCASLYDNSGSWTDLLHPADRDRVLANLEHAEQTGQLDHEYRIVRVDCTTRWIRARTFPIRNEAGELYRVAGVAADITERRSAEEKVRRLNRVYKVLSGINALIVRVRDRDELLRGACAIAVDAGEFRSAWAGIVDPETQEVQLLAHAGAPLGSLATVRRSARQDAPGGKGLMGRALRERVPQVVNDVLGDERLIYRAETLASGFRSFVVLPLMVNGDAVGVLSLLSGDTGFFDDEEMKLLRELAGDITFALENIEKNRQLDYLAYYDPLTGLANRSLFLERLNQVLVGPSRGEAKLALVLADIERLKTINESLGRQAGDELLRQFARSLAGAAEPSRIARVGADQFAVILPAVKGKSDAARKVDEVMRKCFAHPYRLNGEEVRISARAGVVLCPNHVGDAETLLRNAEAALRKAKESAERHAFFSSDMIASVSATLTLESKLRQALERHEFVLHYQPKVDLASKRVTGVEALIRWASPDLGLVPPSQFVPLLETTGLIQEVGAWVLRKAIDDHLRWQGLGLAAPRVAVNVSAMQLRRRDFVANVREAIARGASPAGIDLEITESLVMRDVEGNIEKLRSLHELGLDLAIDDFGTGYSSLGYLAKLPVQALKIDRSFIVTMLDDPNTMTLVSTMISLAHSLRMKVVAEGVDSEEQERFLRLLRCDEMQGYLFSRPLPFDGMTALLAGRQLAPGA